MIRDNQKPPVLETLYLYITSYCNLKCGHCWTKSIFTKNKKEEYLTIEEIKDVVLEAIELGAGAVKITGGEPLLRKDLFELLYWLKNFTLDVSIETNATLIDSKIAQALKNTGVSTVTCALDAAGKFCHDALRGIEGAFEQAIAGIKQLKKNDVTVYVIMSLYKGNRDILVDTIRLVQKLGAKVLKIQPVIPIGRGVDFQKKDNLLTLKEILSCYEEIKSLPKAELNVFFDIPPAFTPIKQLHYSTQICNIKHIISILGNGDISMCGIGYSTPELIFGNIMRNSLSDVWENNTSLNLLRQKIPSHLEGICQQCFLKNYCLGGCRALAYSHYNSLTAPHPFCQKAYEEGVFPRMLAMRRR